MQMLRRASHRCVTWERLVTCHKTTAPSPSSTCPEKLIITECAACGNSDPYYIRTCCWLLLLRSRLLLFCCCCFILLLVAAAPLVIIINVIILFHVVVQLLVIKGKMKKNEGESLMIWHKTLHVLLLPLIRILYYCPQEQSYRLCISTYLGIT
jgi:hypothetical protein